MRTHVVLAQLLTLSQLARLTDRPTRELRRDIGLGELHAVRVGARVYRVPRQEARRYGASLTAGQDAARLRSFLHALRRESGRRRVPRTALLTPSAVAWALRVSRRHVQGLVQARRIAWYQLGGRPVFAVPDVQQFLVSDRSAEQRRALRPAKKRRALLRGFAKQERAATRH